MEGGGGYCYCESGCVVLQGRRRTWFVSCSSGFGWDSSLYRFARSFICWYIGTVEMDKIGFSYAKTKAFSRQRSKGHGC